VVCKKVYVVDINKTTSALKDYLISIDETDKYREDKEHNLKASECPKYTSCSSAFCSVTIEGKYLKTKHDTNTTETSTRNLPYPTVYQAIKKNDTFLTA